MGFATAGHASPDLFLAISSEVLHLGLGDFEERHLSNTAWAFAVADPLCADELFGTTIFVTQCALCEASFSRLQLSQLPQWSLWREERGNLWPGLPTRLHKACGAAFVAHGEKFSQLESDVVQEIRSRVAYVKEEHRCEICGYSIDALVTLNNGEQIVVEVDCPWHFVGRSHRPAGSTLPKHRQLRYFGWHLESVNYWEWDDGGSLGSLGPALTSKGQAEKA